MRSGRPSGSSMAAPASGSGGWPRPAPGRHAGGRRGRERKTGGSGAPRHRLRHAATAPAGAAATRGLVARTEISAGSAATWSARSASWDSSSWTRDPASSARERRVAVSRAWAKYSRMSSARPISEAKPASAPTEEMKWWTERPNGSETMRGASLRRAGGGVRVDSGPNRLPSRTDSPVDSARRQLRHVLGQRGGVALEHQQVDLAEDPLHRLGIERLARRRAGSSGPASAGGARTGLNRSSWSFSPGRAPTISIAMSRSGSRPDRRIIVLARSRIATGSPISSTNTSPLRSLSEPARMISCTASGIVMK